MSLRTTILPILALGAICPKASAELGPQPVADLLYAIRQVESGDRYDGPRGPRGELGAYQFRAQVWYQYTREPFAEARSLYADEVAERHLNWIAQRLVLAGLQASPWNIAAAWNSGVGTVTSGRIPRSTRDYATRVENLVQSHVEIRRTMTPRFRVAVADARR